MINIKGLVIFMLSLIFSMSATGQPTSHAASMVRSHGEEWSAGKAWDYVSGLVAKTILTYCAQYPDDDLSAEAYGWCKVYADNAIDANGNFYNFKKGSLDNIASGKVLFDLYARESSVDQAQAERYRIAADFLYRYLRNEYKRIALDDGKGGFFHKDSYPDQMWLDGLYMGAAFYAEYLSVFAPDDADGWSDIVSQFKTIHKHAYDADKSLCYHGWSANPSDYSSFWANQTAPYKGCSKEFWGRGMGWYAAALVDVLGFMPKEHPDYAAVNEIFCQVAEGIRRWQDADSGVWYQLLQYDDSFVSVKGHRNYLEASASCMFTYALLKGMRLGLLDRDEFSPVAEKAYDGVLATFITESADGVDIHNICRSAGLGPWNKPERNGTADYYLDGSDVNIVSNEGKGIGSFIMASLEYEKYVASAVNPVAADPSSEMKIFDIQGHKCATPPTGVYIEVDGDKVIKKISKQ